MSALKVIAIIGVAVVTSTAAYSAHFVGEQIEYLHQKLSPPEEATNLATDWPTTEAALPKRKDQLVGHLQTISPATRPDFSTEPTVLHPSR